MDECEFDQRLRECREGAVAEDNRCMPLTLGQAYLRCAHLYSEKLSSGQRKQVRDTFLKSARTDDFEPDWHESARELFQAAQEMIEAEYEMLKKDLKVAKDGKKRWSNPLVETRKRALKGEIKEKQTGLANLEKKPRV